DIGTRKKALKELEQSEERYRTLVENAKDVIFRFSTEGVATFFNPAFEELSGMKREEALGKHFSEFIHPDDLALVRENFARTLRGESKPPYEFRVRGKDDKYLTGEIKSVPIVVNGATIGIQGTMSDVTERKKMEASLKEAREFLDRIINAIAAPLFVKDERHRFIMVNDAECALIGRPRDEILGSNDYAFFPREQVDVFWEKDQQVFATGQESLSEEKIRDAAGRERTVLTKKTLYTGTRGARYIVGIVRDITEYKEVERRLELNYRKQNVINLLLRISLENLHTKDILEKVIDIVRSNTWLDLEPKGAVFLMNRDSSALDIQVLKGYDGASRAICKTIISGHPCVAGRAAALGETVFDEKDAECCKGNECYGNYCLPLKYDGRVRGAMALHFQEGRVPGPEEESFLRAIADVVAGILQRKQAEKEREEYQVQMVQSSKLSAIGQMAAGVAHELNNPLAVIMGNTEYLATRKVSEDEVPVILEDMIGAAQRCKKIIANLLEFSRRKALEFQECSVEELVERSLQLSEYQAKAKKVRIEKSYAAGLPKISASSSHLVQVFVNIITNAFQAMPDGGTLHITAAPAEGRPYLEISFTDTGVGIPPSALERIFEPFFTTKASGTGLGLAVSYGLVKHHGGDIRVQSPGAGQGTTFIISLPLERESTA
ncbi:MAG: PAS domain S-box protein, partial [Endomicrobiales bacterium]